MGNPMLVFHIASQAPSAYSRWTYSYEVYGVYDVYEVYEVYEP